MDSLQQSIRNILKADEDHQKEITEAKYTVRFVVFIRKAKPGYEHLEGIAPRYATEKKAKKDMAITGGELYTKAFWDANSEDIVKGKITSEK